MMRASVDQEEPKLQKWEPEEKKKVIVIRDRIYDKLAQKRHTIMIDMLPMAPSSKLQCKKSPKPKSPTVKSPTEKMAPSPSPIEKVTSPTFKTSKKNIRKYAPLMEKCMKIAKSKSCG